MYTINKHQVKPLYIQAHTSEKLAENYLTLAVQPARCCAPSRSVHPVRVLTVACEESREVVGRERVMSRREVQR